MREASDMGKQFNFAEAKRLCGRVFETGTLPFDVTWGLCVPASHSSRTSTVPHLKGSNSKAARNLTE